MKYWPLIAVIAVFLVLVVIFGFLVDLDNSQGIAFVLAGLAFGLVLGFFLDWLLEEAYRRNRELERQIDTAQQLPVRATAMSLPSVTVDGEGDQIASKTLADFLRQRDDEIHQLRVEIDNAEEKMVQLQNNFDAYMKTHPDDLTVIKGIGSVYQWKLRDIGINTFQQLAATDKDKLARMLDIKNWQRVDIEQWIAQARDWAQRG
ncbi:MAG: hypothetical protein ACE5G8_09815 [Anaerolineae bacterium]